VEAVAKGGLYFGKVVADRLPDFEVGQHSIAGEFVDCAKRKAAIGGELLAGDLTAWEAARCFRELVLWCHAAH